MEGLISEITRERVRFLDCFGSQIGAKDNATKI